MGLQKSRFGRISNLLIIFVLLIFVTYLGTQSITAPRLILLVILYVLTVNFSIPTRVGTIGLTPTVAISSLLMLGFQQALIAAAIGLPLAEVVRPYWKPLWQAALVETLSWRDRVFPNLIVLTTLFAIGLLTFPFAASAIIDQWITTWQLEDMASARPILLTLFFFTLFFVLTLLYWRIAGGTLRQFFSQCGSNLALSTLFTIPLAIFIDSAELSTPAFVLISVGIGTFAIFGWNNWQSNSVLRQRLEQFTSLNTIGASLRETLDLNEVLNRIQTQVATLVQADQFLIALRNPDLTWEFPNFDTAPANTRPHPDDLMRWVIDNGRTLDLDNSNMHHAGKHGITLPTPRPRVWLGVPLIKGERTFGVMVLQKFSDSEPFSRWSRQVLLSVAGQASAAIENAQLYGMTDEALAQRVEQLQALLFSITEGVLMLDSFGRIMLVNPTASRLVDSTVEQLQGEQLSLAQAERLGFTPTSLQQLLQNLTSGILPPAQRHEYECSINDQRHIYERDEVAVSSAENDLMGWLMVFRDVTEERERAEWRADLTRMIVHDLRNPITTLISTISLVENRLPVDQRPQIDDLLALARHGTGNMLEMVDSLMDINRAEAGTFVIDAEAMRLPPLIKRVLTNVKPLAVQRGITLAFDSAENLPPVWGDSEILRRVIVNLLDNALKFTPSGGSVSVNATALPATAQHEAGVEITVTDNGPGIPTDMRQRIFDRFVTFNRGGGQVRGTGLGLSFCKLAIESHGGKIWVSESADDGSTFHFSVPGIPIF